LRYLILSDIHANLVALDAVLRDAAGKYDEIVNCGDIVGYGPKPNEVVEWCREHTPTVVRGNHDKACVGLEDLEWFNPDARASAVWTNQELTAENREYLRALPKGPREVSGFDIVHGSPVDEDEYLLNIPEVNYAAPYLTDAVTFFGHTHVQGAFFIHRNGTKRLTKPVIDVENDVLYLVNPGSVGQPRDGDPRAAYAIYEKEARIISFHRAEYNIELTQLDILRAGLPEILAYRLQVGRENPPPRPNFALRLRERRIRRSRIHLIPRDLHLGGFLAVRVDHNVRRQLHSVHIGVIEIHFLGLPGSAHRHPRVALAQQQAGLRIHQKLHLELARGIAQQQTFGFLPVELDLAEILRRHILCLQ
jgi:predicted phosphodiesterase